MKVLRIGRFYFDPQEGYTSIREQRTEIVLQPGDVAHDIYIDAKRRQVLGREAGDTECFGIYQA